MHLNCHAQTGCVSSNKFETVISDRALRSPVFFWFFIIFIIFINALLQPAGRMVRIATRRIPPPSQTSVDVKADLKTLLLRLARLNLELPVYLLG